MNESEATGPRRGIGIWGGMGIGIGVTLLVLLVVALLGFVVMGRCPLCLRAMQDPMHDGMMNDGMMNEGLPADER